jgi:hypothetical protein
MIKEQQETDTILDKKSKFLLLNRFYYDNFYCVIIVVYICVRIYMRIFITCHWQVTIRNKRII